MNNVKTMLEQFVKQIEQEEQSILNQELAKNFQEIIAPKFAQIEQEKKELMTMAREEYEKKIAEISKVAEEGKRAFHETQRNIIIGSVGAQFVKLKTELANMI